MKAIIFIACLTFIWAELSAQSVPSTGTRSTDASSIEGSQGWSSSSEGFKITWSVTQQGGVWNYIYAITDDFGGRLSNRIDHLFLEVSPNITSANLASTIFNSNYVIDAGPTTFPGDLYGISFNIDSDKPTLTFSSTRAPIWGDFGAYSTSSSYIVAYNAGFGTNPTGGTTNFSPWIPTPGGVPVPEPATWLTLSSCLLLVFYRRSITCQVKA